MEDNVEVAKKIDFLNSCKFNYKIIRSSPCICNIDNSDKKVYVTSSNTFIPILQNIARNNELDFGLIGSNDTPFTWYWSDMETWEKIAGEIEEEKKKNGKSVENVSVINKGKIKEYTNVIGYEEDGNSDQLQTFIKRIKEDLQIDMLKDRLKELIESNSVKQIICHGAPGTGKTYTVDKLVEADWAKNLGFSKDCMKRVQFHPSYDYTDFVEGLRPNGENSFVRVDGQFKAFCREAVKEKDKKYLFFIDEINRADLSKVFGELMYCLDEGNRGKDKTVQTQYQNLPCFCYEKKPDFKGGSYKEIVEDEFSDGFYIPENVYIIGTMNDIDRSVDTFDFAMQRRFYWIDVDADTEMTLDVFVNIWKNIDKNITEFVGEDKLEAIAKELKNRARELNKKIEEDFNAHYEIGHAYYKMFANYYIQAAKNTGSAVNGEEQQTKKKTESGYDEAAFKKACEKEWNFSLSQILSSYLSGRKNSNLDEYKDIFVSGKQGALNG